MTATAVDTAQATTRWTVQRWDADQTAWVQRKSGLVAPSGADFARLAVAPYEVSEVLGNLVTNAGWTRVMSLLTDQGSAQAMTATHTRIGVGDSNTTEQYSDTALGATTNKLYKLVTGAATLGTRTLSFATTFGPSEANWAWNEFGMDIGATADSTTVAACFWNHKAGIAQGTKANGQTWAASAAVAFS